MSLESSVILAALASQDDAVIRQVLSSCDHTSQEYLSHAFDSLTASTASATSSAISTDTALAKLAALSANDVFRLFSTVDELYLFGDDRLNQVELDDDDEFDDADEADDDESEDESAVAGSDYAPYAALANSICTFALYSNRLSDELIALCSTALTGEQLSATDSSVSKQRVLRFLTALILCARKLSKTTAVASVHSSSVNSFGFDSGKAQEVIERIEALLKDAQSVLNLDDEDGLDWLPEDRLQELLRYVSDYNRVKFTLNLPDSDLWLNLLAEHGLNTLHSAHCAHLSLLAENAALKLPDSDDVITLRYTPYLAANTDENGLNAATSSVNSDTAAGATASAAFDAAMGSANGSMYVEAGQIAKLEFLNNTKLVIGRNLALFDRVLPASLLYVDLNELEELLCFRRPDVLATIRKLSTFIVEEAPHSGISIDADTAELIVLACLLQHHDEEWFAGFSASSELLQCIFESDNGASLRYLCDCFKGAEFSDLFARRILAYLNYVIDADDENEASSTYASAAAADAVADCADSAVRRSPFAQALRENFKAKLKVTDELSLRLRLENSIIIAPKSLWRALDEALAVDFELSDDQYQPFNSKRLQDNPLLNDLLNTRLAELSTGTILRPAFLSDVIKIGLCASRSLFSATAGKKAQYSSRSRDVNEYCDILLSPYTDRSRIDASKSIVCCDLCDIAKLKNINPEIMLKSTMYLVGYSRELLNHSFHLKVLSEQLFLNAVACVSSTTAMKLSALEDKYSLLSGELGHDLLELVTAVTDAQAEADSDTNSSDDAAAQNGNRSRDVRASNEPDNGAYHSRHKAAQRHGYANAQAQSFGQSNGQYNNTPEELFGDWGTAADNGFGNNRNLMTIDAEELAYEQMDYDRSMEQEQESATVAARNAREFGDSDQEDCEDIFSSDLISLESTLVVEKLESHPSNQCIAVYQAELSPILRELLYIFGHFVIEVNVPDASIYSVAEQLESQEDEPFTVDGVELSADEIGDAIVAKGQSIREGALDVGANLAIDLSLVRTPSDDEDDSLDLHSVASLAHAFKRTQHRIRDRYSERMLSYYQASQLKILQRIIDSKRHTAALAAATSTAAASSGVIGGVIGASGCAYSGGTSAAALAGPAACAVDAIYIIAYDKDIISTAALCRALKLNVLTVSLEALASGRANLESVAMAAGVQDISNIAVVLDNVCLEELQAISPLTDVLCTYIPEDDKRKDGVDESNSDEASRQSTAGSGYSSTAAQEAGLGNAAVLYPHLSALGQHILKIKRSKNYGVSADRTYSYSAYYYGDSSLAAMIEGCMALIKASAGSLCGRMQVFCIDPNLTLLSFAEDEYFNSHDRFRPSHYIDLPLFDNEADRNAMLKLVKSISGDAASYVTHQALSKLDLLSQQLTADDASAPAAATAAAVAAAVAAGAHSSDYDVAGAFSALQDDESVETENGGAKSVFDSYQEKFLAGNAGSTLNDDESVIAEPDTDFSSLVDDDEDDDDTTAIKHEVIRGLDLGPDNPRGQQEIQKAMEVISRLFIGGHEWRPYQAQALPQILSKRNDYLISIPTGGGKSVLFQGPALYRSSFSRKLTLVISPLRALILDQIIELRNKGFTGADYLSGDRSRTDTQESFANIISGKTQILYITPERFRSRRFFTTICERFDRDGGAEYIVFDEAHCISQWGKEFRPDYLNAANLSKLLRKIFPLSIIMCSATMTNQVTSELCEYMLNPLRLGEGEKNYNPIRDHIQIRMQEVDKEFDSRISAIVKFIRSENIDFSKSRMLIFCPTRKLCEEVSSALNFEANKAALKDKSYRSSEKQHKAHNAVIDMAGHVDYFHAKQSAATRKDIYERYKPEYAHGRDNDADLTLDDSLIMQLEQSGEFSPEELADALAEQRHNHGNQHERHADSDDHTGHDEQYGDADGYDSIFSYNDSDAEETHSKGAVYVLCSTKAFGMGMDIPNIHYVVHYSPPAVFEDYLQEVGRAGRDMAAYHDAFPSGRKLPALCLYNPDDFEKANEQLNNSLISWNEIINSDNTLRTYIQQFKSLDEATTSPVMTPFDVLDRNIDRILLPNVDPKVPSDGVRNRLIFSTLESIGRIRMQFSGMCPIPVRVNLKNLHAYLDQAQIAYAIATGSYNYDYDEDASSIIDALPPLAVKAMADNTAQSIEIEPVVSLEKHAITEEINRRFDDDPSTSPKKNQQEPPAANKTRDKAHKIPTTCAAKTVWTQGKLSNHGVLLQTLNLGNALADAVDREVEAAAITLDKLNAQRSEEAIAKAKAASAIDATIVSASDDTAAATAADAAANADATTNAAAASAADANATTNASAAADDASEQGAEAVVGKQDAAYEAKFNAAHEVHDLKQRTLENNKVSKSGATSMHKVESLGDKVDRASLVELMSEQLIDINVFAKDNNTYSSQAINSLIELMHHDAVDISAPFSMKFKHRCQHEINFFFKDAFNGSSTDENYLLTHLPTISIAIKVLRTVLTNAHKSYMRALRTADETSRFEHNRSTLNHFAEHYYQNSDQAAASQASTAAANGGDFDTSGLSADEIDLIYGKGTRSKQAHEDFAERMAQLHRVAPNDNDPVSQDYAANQGYGNHNPHNGGNQHGYSNQHSGSNQRGDGNQRDGFNLDANFLITRKKCYQIITEIIRPIIDDFPRQKVVIKKAETYPNGQQSREESKIIVVMPWADPDNKQSYTSVEAYLKYVTRNVFKLLSQLASYLPDIHVRYNKQLYHEASNASALLLEVHSEAFHLFLDVMQDDLVSLIELIQLKQVDKAKSSRTVQSDLVASFLHDNDTGITPIGERLAAASSDDDDDVTIYINDPASRENQAKSEAEASSATASAESTDASGSATAVTAADTTSAVANTANSDISAGNREAATGETTVRDSNGPTLKKPDDYNRLFDLGDWHNNWCAVIIKLGLMHNDETDLLENYELSNSRKYVDKYLPKLKERIYGYEYFKFLLDSLNTLNFVSSSMLINYGVEVFTDPDSMTPMDSGESTESKFYQHRKNFDMLEEFKRLRINIMSLFCMEIPEERRNQFIEDVFMSSCPQDLAKSIKEHSDPNSVLMQQLSAHALELEELKLADNEEQWEIYQAPFDSNINVMAGPGSGKTHVLTLRVARLIYREHVDPESILVLAYNRAVVIELKDRLSTLFSKLGMSRVGRRIKVYTFHGLAKRCLRDSSQGVETSNWEHAFADKLTNEPQLFSSLFPRVEYIMIDEFQDITSTRLEILKIIRTQVNNIHLFTIGDINQSIYGFDRINQPQTESMRPELITPEQYASKLKPQPYYRVLEQEFKPTTMSLSLNYRSYQKILKKASRFLTDTRFLPQTAPCIQRFAPNHGYVRIFDNLNGDAKDYWFNHVPRIIAFANKQNEEAAKLFKQGEALILQAEEEKRQAKVRQERSKSKGKGTSNGHSSALAANEPDRNETANILSSNANNRAGLEALKNILSDEFDDAIPEISPANDAFDQQTAAAQGHDESEALIAMRIRDSVHGVNIEEVVDNLTEPKTTEEEGHDLIKKSLRTRIQSIAILFRTNNEVYLGLSKIRDLLPDDIQLRIQGSNTTECFRERELYEIAYYIYRNADRLCVTSVAAPEALSSAAHTDADSDEDEGSNNTHQNAVPFADIQSAQTVSQLTTVEEFKRYILALMHDFPNWDHVLLDVAYCIVLSFFEQWQDSDRPAHYSDLYEHYTDLLSHDDGGQIWKLYERYRNERIIKDERINLVLTTMHKVKGLEFDLVMVTPSMAPLPLSEHFNVQNPEGFSRRRFPDVNAALAASNSIPLSEDEKADIDEERRLYYVAYTRARKYLYAYQAGREQALDACCRYINRNEANFAFVEKSPSLDHYFISFTAQTQNFAVNTYIRRYVSRNQPVILEMVQKPGGQRPQLVCNVLHQIDERHRPVIIARLSSNNPLFKAMQTNNVYHLSGLFISNIVAWSYQDTLNADDRNRLEYEEKLRQSQHAYEPFAFSNLWCEQAKHAGYVYVVLLAGYGTPF